MSAPPERPAAGADASPASTSDPYATVRQLKDLLVPAIGHRLRTAVTIIAGYALLLAQDYKGPDNAPARNIQRHLAQVQEELERLTELVEWVVARLPAAPRYVDLNQVLQDVADQLHPLATRRSVKFIVYPSSHPVMVLTVDWGVSLALTLLASECIRHTCTGGTLEAQIDGGGREGVVVFMGDGKASDLTQCLDQGMRLGLPLARELVDRLNGNLSLESKAQGGFSLRVAVPRG